MKGLFKRHTMWWLRFTPLPGLPQQRFALGTDDMAEAIIRARDIQEQVTNNAREVAGSCQQEIEIYLHEQKKAGLAVSTLSSRRYVLTKMVDKIGVKNPRLITKAGLQRWFDRHREQNAHTAVAYLNIAHFWMKWLVKRGKIPRDATRDVDIPKLPMRQRRNFLLPHQAVTLLEAASSNQDLKFAIYCGLHAGLRKLEVVEARANWFDLHSGLLHVQATDTFQPKDRDNRTIPLTNEFADWLRAHYTMGSGYVLAPKVQHGAYRYRFDFRAAFVNLVKRCGFKDLTFHDLRRTFASLHVSSGTSIYKVARWLGDRVDVVEDHYGHLIPNDSEINRAWVKAEPSRPDSHLRGSPQIEIMRTTSKCA